LKSGIVDLDLFEWFRIADKHLGDDPRLEQEVKAA
jgi:hypothetical protein